MIKNNKSTNRLIVLSVIIAIILSGCSKNTPSSAEVTELKSRSKAAGFLAEKAEENNGFIAGSDQRDKASDYAYLYDNALAAVVLSSAGAQEQAEMITDAIVFVQDHDRTYRDGRLRNAYIAGDPRSDSGRSIAVGRVTVRLPGFWQNGEWQEDAYTVSTSTGNMAWTILALCEVSRKASSEKQSEYLAAAMKAADFVITLKSENIRGGFTAGYEGWDQAQTRIPYLSTEHNIDLYAAFSTLSDAVSEINTAKAEDYRKAAEEAKHFALSMYDESLGCFYTGTRDDGETVSDGVIPLDTNSLSILVFGGKLNDPYKILSFIENRMAVGGGFDFSDGDLDGIWNEGTAQMAVCYHKLNSTEKYNTVMAYLKTQTARDGSIPAADRDGVSTGFVIDGTDTPWEFYNVQSISATAWLALAQLGQSPFDFAVSEEINEKEAVYQTEE